ncbi:PadR family transcriptional regulator [Phytohabitans houttuyneae]|uniref:PadR family transcriptional regulator n=1 Tax=Phytohabitans houttuyneae TaxID=1076126 RepID=A0A6V8KLN7_9ACTN|nr:PadR family transcriptional regulator [Phytohabitans houttuyneae]
MSNLLALTVLNSLVERPMHPYELASVLRARGKDHSIKIKWGSLYTVMQNLEKHGFVEATGTTREGRRPERTVYAITPAGLAEVRDWLRELVGVPEREFPRFEAALAEIGVLPPDEVVELLEQRLRILDAELAEGRVALGGLAQGLPRVFLIEMEYHMAMVGAEIEWIRGLLQEIREGTLTGVDAWREWHATGQVPESITELAKLGSHPKDEEDGDPDS